MPPRDGSHPPLRWLADRADGKLPAARAAKLAAHLAGGCAACAAREAALARTISMIKAGPLPAPPKKLRRAASRLHLQARIAAAFDTVRGVVARLVHDGRMAPALALRSAPGDERRMLWAMDHWEIDACLVTGARGSDLLGQILPLDETPQAIVQGEIAAQSGSNLKHATLTPDGRFTFRGLPAGVWTMVGRVGSTQFKIPAFVVERAG